MNISEIIARIEARTGAKAEKGGNSWVCRCPAHEDHNPSLSVTEGEMGAVLVKCFANCSFDDIVSALGLQQTDFFPQTESANRRIKAYDYTDAEGKLLFQVCRYQPKAFRQRRPDGKDGWIWNLSGVIRVLYRLPEVLKAKAEGSPVFVVEGEKDADNLADLGLTATCNPGGAGKWNPGYTENLTGVHVILVPDKDDPGRKHVAQVGRQLSGHAASVTVVELPDRNGVSVKDASDWIAAGGTRDELVALVEQAPEWAPSAPDEWPEINDAVAFEPLPDFPLHVLPPVLAAMAQEIAECVKVPVEVPALAVLCVTGLAVGRDLLVQVKRGLLARSNLFGLCFMARGERKSTAYSFAVAPIYSWMRTHKEEWEAFVSRREMRRAKITKLKEVLSSPKTPEEKIRDFEGKLTSLVGEDQTDTMRSPYILAEDATPEALIRIMAETEGTLGLFSDDARFALQIMTGIYNNGQTRESIHIKSFDGTTPINDQRVCRAPIIIERPFEGLLILVQMDWLRKLGEQQDFFDSGFFSRNLFCVPDSWVGKRDEKGRLLRAYTEQGISEETERAYSDLVHGLLEKAYKRCEGVLFSLSPQAKDLWITYNDGVEAEMAPDGLYGDAVDLAIRYAPYSLRLALLLSVCNGHAVVELDDVEHAIELVECFAAHARRALQAMRKFSLPDSARRLLRHVRKYHLKRLTVRDAQHSLGFKTQEEAVVGFSVLTQRGYCRPEAKSNGRHSPAFEINPNVFGGDSNE